MGRLKKNGFCFFFFIILLLLLFGDSLQCGQKATVANTGLSLCKWGETLTFFGIFNFL